MNVLLVHPSPLMYSEIYLRLEPLGLERVAQAVRSAGHEVRLLDLQIFRHEAYFHELRDFKTQAVLNRKHLGFAVLRRTFSTAFGLLLQGQTNFLRMLWKFSRVYNPERQYMDHLREVKYALRPPVQGPTKLTHAQLYVHAPGSAKRTATHLSEAPLQ